jgi:sterol desaturase/sphingolipid hydroxylase (fatty acid hydroxylase superfamily)
MILAPQFALGLSFGLTTLVYAILDLSKPEWYQKSRIAYDRKEYEINAGEYIKILPICIVNIIVTGVALCHFLPLIWSPANNNDIEMKELVILLALLASLQFWEDIIVFQRILTMIIGFSCFLHFNLPCWELFWLGPLAILSQIYFWCSHWMVHHNEFLYKTIHARHHQHTLPFALTAISCTPWEMLLLNLPAIFVPLIICNPPLLTSTIWCFLAGLHTSVVHAGHSGSAYHDAHHMYVSCNYGATWLDQLFDTFRHHHHIEQNLTVTKAKRSRHVD